MSISIVFVAYASLTAGAGHVRRSSVLARHLISVGFKAHLRGNVELDWLVRECEESFDSVSNLSETEFFDVLVIDTYDPILIQRATEKIKSKFTIQIADGFTPLIEPFPLLWLEPIPPSDEVLKFTEVLGFGISYFPLRKFKRSLGFSRVGKEVLVTSGGTSDLETFNLLMVASQSLEFREIHFNFFTNKHPEKNMPLNWTVFETGQEMELVLAECDTVISAAGTSMWDFLANEFPLAAFKYSDNQKMNFEYVVDNKLALPFDFRNGNIKDVSLVLESLLLSSTSRESLTKLSSSILDFEGPGRFSKIIQSRFAP